MATNSRLRPPTGGNIKQGICRNTEYLDPDKGTTGPCPKCASGEIQKVNVQRLSDFKCSVCGSKLEPVKAGMPKWLIPACIALVLIIGCGIFWAINSDTPAPETTYEEVETTDCVPDKTIPTVQTDSTESYDKVEVANDAKRTTQPETRKVLGGAATLSADGKTITFTKKYVLDLQSIDDETLTFYPNDKIIDAIIVNGYLRGGNYVSTSGEEQYLSAFEVKL